MMSKILPLHASYLNNHPSMRIQFYGIRHHGPGSARSLLEALEAQQPDCLLIEHPEDAAAALGEVATLGLVPPVALLVYDPKDFSKASYYPFARFSPEWQALHFAIQNGIPVKAMDLPAGTQWMVNSAEGDAAVLLETPSDPENQAIAADPLGYLAALAGYPEGERWWDAVLEQVPSGSSVFEAVAEMMRLLRDTLQRTESPETLLREAFMRKTIRETAAAGFQNMAVVCGAWHVPALEPWQQIKATKDNALLRGRKKIKTETAWVPWTYERLAFESGYGAGILSPAWYELLFDLPAEAISHWMVRAARLLRGEDIDVSGAHAIEAVHLAEALAALRGRPVAGVEDMQAAALSVYVQGNEQVFELVRRRLVIGEVVGAVPATLSAIPLQRDFEKEVRSAHLSKEYAAVDEVSKQLDLRVPGNLKASLLLHRLGLLGITWGRLNEQQGPAGSTFHEVWRLKWLPDYALQIVRAGRWGNTVESAAVQCVLERCRQTEQLPDLTRLTEDALRAALTDAVPPLMEKLERVAAVVNDVPMLMDALPPLVRIVRYGNVRRTDSEAVGLWLHRIIPRIAAGLPAACLQLDEEPADAMLVRLWETHRHIMLMSEEALSAAWLSALEQLSEAEAAHPLLRGSATRILFDRRLMEETAASNAFSMALSAGHEPVHAARWVEGFLHGSGLLLIHHPPLWKLLDEWVAGLREAHFMAVLPLLRRAFASFAAAERQKMLAMAKDGVPVSALAEVDRRDPARAAMLATVLSLLLGDPVEN